MESFAMYFLGTLAFNLFTAFFMFAIIVFSRRKEREITPLKGTAVFLIGWLGGSILVFVFELLFALTGANVDGEQLKSGIAIIMILSVMYAAFSWLSKSRIAGTSR